jgi:NAD(P)-dependent dehydrogenase (short-subunit alcohol dehydrogenase family)
MLMAQEGAKVIVADNGSFVDGTGASQRPAQQVVEEIRELGGEALADFGDVSDWKSAEALVAKAINTWGKLDILVNAAGNFRLSTITDLVEKDWDDVIRVHLRGTMCTTHFAALHWKERQEYGRLINFTSLAGTGGLPNMVAYSTAKAGIIGFTKVIANSMYNYNVTANAISPGAATRMSDRGRGPESIAYFQKYGHWPREDAEPERDPAHVAPLVTYLASPNAANISGRIFGARGHTYTLLSDHDEERTLWSQGDWDLNRLFKEFPETLGKGLSLHDIPLPMESLDRPLERDFPGQSLG